MSVITAKNRKRSAKKPPAGLLKTKADLAEAFGGSITTARNWCRKPDFPGGAKGPWDRSEVEIYLQRTGSPLVKPPAEVDAAAEEVRRRNREMADEELLLKRANRQRAEIDRDKLRETLIPRDEAIAVLNEITAKVRDQLMLWPDQATVSVPAEWKPVVIAELKRQVYRLLNNLAKNAESAVDRGL